MEDRIARRPDQHTAQMRRCGALFLMLPLLWVVCGCALVKLREDTRLSKDACVITGEIVAAASSKNPIVVVAYSHKNHHITVEDYAVLSSPGSYELLVQEGRRHIFAFEDANGNMAYDKGEPAGYFGKPEKPDDVFTPWGGVVWGIDVKISANFEGPAPNLDRKLLAYSGGKTKPCTSAGDITDLDNPVFTAEQGENGFWAPLEAFRRAGCNIYFLEPYDRKKIPVLLVHGAAGSPQDWRYFIENMDRSIYQPWIFHYPSGARLQTVSFFLRKKLYDIDRKYRIEHLFVVAHSMGGLVSRSALVQQDSLNRSVKLFISISTPWNGEQRARTGVEHSPAVIPSWKDMEPDSPFIRDVFSVKLPNTMRYFLFFGHKGGGSLFRQNNDSTVTLESMLDPRAQADALKVMGFNEDHVSILNSPEVIAQYKTIASTTAANLDKTLMAGRGYVHVRHGFSPPDVKIPLQMTLVLTPRADKETETQLKIDPFVPVQETEGVVPGDYEASLCALGFRTDPANSPVTVAAGRITEVGFTLSPQGMVAGLITATTAADDSYWGYIQALSDKVKVSAIHLAGADMKRTLRPADGMNDRAVLKAFLASRDYAYKNQFAFFDVPAGNYTLSIEADGCEPFTKDLSVQPGEFIPPPPFRLTPK
jgi:pimeloyl-ACP methyl ester carboxylesterase